MTGIFLQFTYHSDDRCFENTRLLLPTIIAPDKNQIDPALASTKTLDSAFSPCKEAGRVTPPPPTLSPSSTGGLLGCCTASDL